MLCFPRCLTHPSNLWEGGRDGLCHCHNMVLVSTIHFLKGMGKMPRSFSPLCSLCPFSFLKLHFFYWSLSPFLPSFFLFYFLLSHLVSWFRLIIHNAPQTTVFKSKIFYYMKVISLQTIGASEQSHFPVFNQIISLCCIKDFQQVKIITSSNDSWDRIFSKSFAGFLCCVTVCQKLEACVIILSCLWAHYADLCTNNIH